jgi:5-methylcytosine-specific restriction protein A
MGIKRPCTQRGCPEYALDHASKCGEHYKKAQDMRFARIEKKPEIQSMYNGIRWKRLRAKYIRANPFCAECGKKGTDVDHRIKHLGAAALFYDEGNLQTLCKGCHGVKTMRGE